MATISTRAPRARRQPRVLAWAHGYQRSWLKHDVVAGLVVGSVVVPQAVAYAQIAGLPPQAGLMAAPGALIAYALLGTSRTLVVSATTASSALSASAVGPLAHHDVAQFALLSAALAILTAAVLVAAGALGLGRITDLVSKPVMTGFLFGLGLTVSLGQLPKIFGVQAGTGHFFPQLWTLIGNLSDTQWWTLATGVLSIAALILFRRLVPAIPGILVTLVLAIVVSAAVQLSRHGVAVVGTLPSAYPRLGWPSASLHDYGQLVGAALGILVLTAEAGGVSRAIASKDGYTVDPNQDLVAIGASNLLAGLSHGFVQSGGASQTMAAENAGGETQLGTLVAAGVVLITGAFLTSLFADLPEATLAAIVIVAIAGFFRVDELRRFVGIRRSAIVLSSIALVGVLLIGVLPGLLVAAGLSLIVVVKRLSRPEVGALARDPETGAWGRADRHASWETPAAALALRVDGPLFYANAVAVKESILELHDQASETPLLVLDLSESSDLDVETLDALCELAEELERQQVALRLVSVRSRFRAVLERAGVAGRFVVEPTLDAAVRSASPGEATPPVGERA